MATPIQSVAGIGPAAALLLQQHGFLSAEDLARASVEALTEVPGFQHARASRTIEIADGRILSDHKVSHYRLN